MEEEQREVMKQLARREAARDWLTKNVDGSSVIDMNWYEYFRYSIKDRLILINLLAFTEYKTYSELHEKFEGFTLAELLTLP